MFEQDPAAAPAHVPVEVAATYVPADRYGFLQGAGGRLRVASWNGRPGGKVKGTVVVLGGRAEFIEKYATEIVGELLGRDYSVIAMDWRGQGLSDRPLPDRGKAHIDNFATYIADLQLFLDTIVAPAVPRPVLALCHSMGAHITLRALAEHGSGVLSAGVLVSPMTGLKREAFLRSVLGLMPEVPAVDERYLFGTGPFIRLADEFNANVATHDERRYRFTEHWFAADPRLSVGGPTLGWARQAARSMTACLAPGYLERIDLPLVMISAGQDPLVEPLSHAPVAARLRHGELFTVAAAKHEVMMEADEYRALFWEAFDRLARGVLGL